MPAPLKQRILPYVASVLLLNPLTSLTPNPLSMQSATPYSTSHLAYSQARADGQREKEDLQARVEKSDEKRILETAERYHSNGEMEDAIRWYGILIRDFPDSDLADDASLRQVLIGCALLSEGIDDAFKEIGKANEQKERATEYISISAEYEKLALIKAVQHADKATEIMDEAKTQADSLLNHYTVFKEKYMDGSTAVWKAPASEFYNQAAEAVEREGKADPLELRYNVGSVLYHTMGRSQELEEIIDVTENDPYSDVRYRTEKLLKQKPYSISTQLACMDIYLAEADALIREAERLKRR